MRRVFVISGLMALAALPALAEPTRDEVMAGAERCDGIADNRVWLDCFYGSAQPMRSVLNLPPANPAQVRLVPPRGAEPRRVASARHATRRGDIGEMFLAQQARLLVSQRKNFANQRGVVPRAFQTNFAKTFPTQLTKIRVVGVLQNGHHRRRLQREAPRIRAILAGGGLLGGGKRTCRQTRELFFILYEMFPRIGGIKNVL